MTNRAVVYARFSSDNQREQPIDAQVRACEEFAKRNGLTIVKTYTDRAKTATSDKRPDFQQMVADSARDLFDTVIVHKLDRFSRDKYDSVYYKRKLKQNRVRLVSVIENLDGSPESVILESMLEGVAQYYSLNLAREVMKGMKENAYQCRHTGGTPPLGYDVDPLTKRLVINEEEADTVRIIFGLYLKGFGYDRMMTVLNEMGRKTKKGKPFGKNSLHDILINEKYAGVYTFNVSASKDDFGKRNNHAKKDNESIIRIEGGVPQIVERDVFDAVQKKMERNRRTPGSYKSKGLYLLSGNIYCGECSKDDGTPYAMAGNRHVSGRNKSMYVSYRCSNRDRTKIACANTELRREYVEGYVLRELERRIFNEGNIPTLVKQLNEHLNKTAAAGKQEMKRAEAELEKVTRQIDNIVSAVASGSAFQSLLDKMGDLEGQQAMLQNRVDELRSARRGIIVTADELRGLFAQFRRAVENGDVPELKRFVDAYVDKVIVHRDRVEVTFRVQAPHAVSGDRPLEIHSESERRKLPKDTDLAPVS